MTQYESLWSLYHVFYLNFKAESIELQTWQIFNVWEKNCLQFVLNVAAIKAFNLSENIATIRPTF